MRALYLHQMISLKRMTFTAGPDGLYDINIRLGIEQFPLHNVIYEYYGE